MTALLYICEFSAAVVLLMLICFAIIEIIDRRMK